MPRIELKNLRGIDTTSSVHECAPIHAVELDNFICDGGINRKRPGLQEAVKLEGKINGIFAYAEGSVQVHIIHADNKLYRVILADNSLNSTVKELALPRGTRIANARSWSVTDKGILYILCGDYLAYRNTAKSDAPSYALERVTDNADITYIPTTSISIDAEGAEEKLRLDFEPANLLSKWRINKLQGLPHGTNDDELKRTYYLDTAVLQASKVEISAERLIGGVLISEQYRNKANSKNEYGTDLYLVNAEGNLTAVIKGTVGFNVGRITFANTVIANRASDDCISVTFCHVANDYSGRITGCRFGTQFGLGGNNDRLFVAGNQASKNIDYYSESNDYTYFADKNYTVLGGEHSAITGYSRINDGSLGIHKSRGDASGIYYRTSTTQSYTDEATGAIMQDTVFPIAAGALGQFCTDWATCKRLDNDPLFLSDDGVYSVTLGNSVVTNERYAKERSMNIASELKAAVKSASVSAEALGGKYYLFMSDTVYIADSRYKFSDSNLKEDTFNYEWWRWRLGHTVTCTAVSDGKMFIGSLEGRIFRLTAQKTDVTYTKHDRDGLITIAYGEGSSPAIVTLNREVMDKLFPLGKTTAEVQIYGEGGENIVQTFVGKDKSIRNVVYKAVKTSDSTMQLYTRGSNSTAVTLRSGSSAASPRVAEVHTTPINARMVSPVFDLGSNEHFKNITKTTVVSDSKGIIEYDICIRSRNHEARVKVVKTGTFDFNYIDFNYFTFPSPTFALSDISQLRMRGANYVQIAIESDNDKECAVSSIAMEYTVGRKIHGGNY